MEYTLSQIIDIDELKHLCESFTAINGSVTAILDLEGNVLVSTGWQPICTQFHRINPETRKKCNESDTILAGQLKQGDKYNAYKCKNGLIDVAIPIVIETEHLGNFFTGQVLTEKPDIECFRRLAKQFGFDEKKYLAALENVPIFSEEQIKKNAEFLVKLTETIGKTGLKNLKSIEQAKQLEIEKFKLKEINEEFAALNEESITQNEELRTAKEKAEESKNNWQVTFDAVEDIVMLVSAEHEIIEINKMGMNALGFLKDEIIGRKCFHLVHNTSNPIPECPCKISLEQKKTINQEYSIDNKTYQLTAYPVINANDEVTHFTHIVKDITDEKVKENKISGLSKIIEQSLNEIYIFDKNTLKFNFANKGALKNIGYTLAEIKDLTPINIKPNFSLKQYKKLIAPLIYKETEIVRFETIHQRKNGSIYDVLINLQLAEYDNNEVFVAFVSDISVRKKAQTEINRQKKLFETMFNSIQEGIVITDTNREILLANNGMFTTFGYNPEELIGKETKILYADVDKFKESGQKVFNKEVSSSNKEDYLTYYKNKSGKIFPGETFGTKLYDEKGQWIGNIGIMRNVTEREKFITDLKAAKELAEEANRLKSRFINNLSHEIRTPMNGIIGFSEMINKPNITDEKRSFYSKIVQNSSRQLLRIIDDILEISTLETKQEKLHETEFYLNDLLMELLSIFRLKADEQNIPIYVKKALNDRESIINSDKTKINKILSNLLENALKFTPDGFIELGYFIEKSKLIIYVKDTGIGISPENHNIIFERFVQEDKEMFSIYGGLGLGLSICKGNAQLLGGDIIVESEKGKGTTFYVKIPYKPVKTKNKRSSKSVSSNSKENKIYTILVAEDEEVNSFYIKVLLEEEIDGNYILIHAKNGKEAVDLCLQNKNIDLVLMDIKMPIMNGHEATERIKKTLPDLPIIAQTAYSTESDRELALKHGCDDFITKPLNIERLVDIINKYLKVK